MPKTEPQPDDVQVRPKEWPLSVEADDRGVEWMVEHEGERSSHATRESALAAGLARAAAAHVDCWAVADGDLRLVGEHRPEAQERTDDRQS
jgi:hypothetical protein